MSNNVDKLVRGLDELCITFDDKIIDKFISYYIILIEKNKIMNLTAITELDEVIEKHFLDSISLCKYFDFNKDINLIDVGTGAGFPGVPLKIVFPDIHITLLDSLGKRVNFLNEVIEIIGLKDIQAIHGRAEDYGRNPDYREKYDLCVSRAVANMSSLAEYCLPFVKVNGFFIPYKSGDCDEEVTNSKSALKKLSGKITSIKKFNLPDSDISRSFVFVKKYDVMSDKYPRKSGLPTKKPL